MWKFLKWCLGLAHEAVDDVLSDVSTVKLRLQNVADKRDGLSDKLQDDVAALQSEIEAKLISIAEHTAEADKADKIRGLIEYVLENPERVLSLIQADKQVQAQDVAAANTMVASVTGAPASIVDVAPEAVQPQS